MLRGKLLANTAMADYTSWRVGGPARQLYLPADLDDLMVFLRSLPTEEPVMWFGLGSNTLVRDGGIDATIIITQGQLHRITQIDETSVCAEAGVACPALARFCGRVQLGGCEFLAGIPGTVGGALAMNAGCHGGETWDVVKAVETIDRHGERHIRYPSEYQIAYRSVQGIPGEWFVAGHFQLKSGAKDQIFDRIRALLDHRAATQPTSEPNCGSVFRNPPNDYAARLIESAGLKGKCIGGASVSTKHANFIVNNGGATATDIETLIALVASTVEQVHGVRLIREVHIVGKNL